MSFIFTSFLFLLPCCHVATHCCSMHTVAILFSMIDLSCRFPVVWCLGEMKMSSIASAALGKKDTITHMITLQDAFNDIACSPADIRYELIVIQGRPDHHQYVCNVVLQVRARIKLERWSMIPIRRPIYKQYLHDRTPKVQLGLSSREVSVHSQRGSDRWMVGVNESNRLASPRNRKRVLKEV